MSSNWACTCKKGFHHTQASSSNSILDHRGTIKPRKEAMMLYVVNTLPLHWDWTDCRWPEHFDVHHVSLPFNHSLGCATGIQTLSFFVISKASFHLYKSHISIVCVRGSGLIYYMLVKEKSLVYFHV